MKNMLPSTIDILRRLDIEQAKFRAGPIFNAPGGLKDSGEYAGPDEVVLASMHKVRLEFGHHFTDVERQTSHDWLLSNGWRLPDAEFARVREELHARIRPRQGAGKGRDGA
jgi:hypothetical protein